MPRPEVKMVKFTIDGREVEAPEGMMLADAALEYGDHVAGRSPGHPRRVRSARPVPAGRRASAG